MRRLACLLLCLLLMAGAACAEEALLLRKAEQLFVLLQKGDEEGALNMMDSTMQGLMKGSVASFWPTLSASGGEFLGTGIHAMSSVDGYRIIELELRFERQQLIQRTVFDAQGLVAGLFFKPGKLAVEPAPEGVLEKELVVNAGTGFPVDGLYCRPEGGVRAAVLLLQGSGPSDRDESVIDNKPFRDIAHGLATLGIASLRFDKRTFAYAGKFASSPDRMSFTVDQEYTEDALAAMALLHAKPELQGKPVYLLGHSLAATLLAHIDAGGAQAAGYILLAGTPRFLLQALVDQNKVLVQELQDAGNQIVAALKSVAVASLQRQIKRLPSLSEEEAKKPENMIAGMPAWYLKHLMDIDALKGYLAADKPTLVLWGEKDRQVTEKDFLLWQEGLSGLQDVHFIRYPGLNHLLGRYEGEPVPFSQLLTVEYAQRTPVDAQLIRDMAEWMLAPERNK